MADPQDVVLAAVTAAGPAGTDLRAWQRRVMGLVPAVAVLLGEAQYGPIEVAQHALDAKGFPAEFISYEMEEKSKRALLQLRTTPSKRYPEGIEPIRTYPSWSDMGFLQIYRVKTLKPGDKLFIYKSMEDKAGQSDGEQVRVLAHFEVIGSASNPGTSTPVPQADPGGADPAAATHSDPPAPAAPAPGARGSGSEAVKLSMDRLDTKQKIAAAKRLMKEIGTDWADPSDDDLDKVLAIISEARDAT